MIVNAIQNGEWKWSSLQECARNAVEASRGVLWSHNRVVLFLFFPLYWIKRSCVPVISVSFFPLTDRVCHQQGLSLWVPFQNSATAVTNLYKGMWSSFPLFTPCFDWAWVINVLPIKRGIVLRFIKIVIRVLVCRNGFVPYWHKTISRLKRDKEERPGQPSLSIYRI